MGKLDKHKVATMNFAMISLLGIHLPRRRARVADSGSRTSCAKCGGKIPPGRPGRNCKLCRESQAAKEQDS